MKKSWTKAKAKAYAKQYYKKNKKQLRAKAAAWVKANKEKHNGYRYKSTYGISLEEYKKLVEHQNGVCAICKIVKHKKNKPLHIDHDHKSGKVRALLCNGCNISLGGVKENLQTLKNMIRYLLKYGTL